MTSIERIYPFSESDIDRKNYTASLLMLCSAHGLIGGEKAERIKNSILDVYLESLEQFTYRESTSVSMKYAQSIYESVLYRADVYFLSLHSFSLSVEQMINADFAEVLAKGSELILKYFSESQIYHKHACENKLAVSSATYNYALNHAFTQFRKQYSARFFAKNIMTEIYYPLLYPVQDEGVMYIHRYYKSLMLENLFCSLFPKSEIHQLLIKYGEAQNCRYSDLLFNICEVVLNNFLMHTLVGEKTLSLRVTQEEAERVRNQFMFSEKEEIKNTVRNAFGQYYKHIGNHQLILYLRPYIDTFSGQLYHCLQNGIEMRLVTPF